MNYYVAGVEFSSDNALMHHGIKGQKWGVRRFQNEDGSLTEEGKKRYSVFITRSTDAWNEKYSGDDYSGNIGNPSKKVKSTLNAIENNNRKRVELNEKIQKANKANEERRKHPVKELFNPNNKYTKAYKEADKEREKAVEDFLSSSSIEMSLYIDSLPKKNRRAAYAYAHEVLGLDW